MIFDSRKDDTGIVTDVFGHLIPYPICGNTETGWVLCFETDENDDPVLGDDEIRKKERRFAAPLTVVPLPQGWSYKTDPRPRAREIPPP